MSLAKLHSVEVTQADTCERAGDEELLRDLADDFAQALINLTPGIDQQADCLESALEAASFFDDAGMERHLFHGVLATRERRDTVITPHYWLEVPLEDTKLYIDLTLPHWLTDPDYTETDYDIPTVLTEEDSLALGRRYQGKRIDFPDLCGTDESGHFHEHPLSHRFTKGLINRYMALAPAHIRESWHGREG